MIGKSFLGEWKSIFKSKKLLIPVIAILFIPVLYSGMFLWAFLDPYAKMEELPVAVVNEDTGASFNDKKLHVGDELVDNLMEDKKFDFVVVDKEEGYEKLKNQEFYMLIEIPKDFSKNATTVLDDNPKKLEVVYVPNEGLNFLSAQIGETAMEILKSSVSEQIIKTYSETIFDNIETMADGFQTASESAGTLSEGLTEINDGSTTLKDSLATLAEKQIEFKNGVSQVDEGVGQLSSGSEDLSTGLGLLSEAQGKLQSGSEEVKAGLDEAAAGSTQISEGMNTAYSSVGQMIDATGQLQSGADSLSSNLTAWSGKASEAAAGATKVSEGIAALQQSMAPYMAALPEQAQAQLKAVMEQLAAGSSQVASGTSQLAGAADQLAGGSQTLSSGLGQLSGAQTSLQQGLGQLNEGSSSLNTGLGKLQAGQEQVVSGMQQFGSKLQNAATGSQTLNAGIQTLAGGVTKLSDGSEQLAEGSSKLSDGASKLADGTSTAAEGAKEFEEALTDAAKDSSEVNATDKTHDMISQPLEVTKEAVDHVPNYGTGFAPYFLSLGLFVGALLLSIVFPLYEPAVEPKNAFTWFMSKFGVMAIIGTIQAVIAAALVITGLDIEVQSVPLFFLFSIVTSITFMALIQFFVTSFGNPGRFIAILILILQLTTSAGTFPLELIPNFLQKFNEFLPMTYSVKGYKAAISSGDMSVLWSNVGTLCIFTALFVVGSISYFFIKFKKMDHTNESVA
ncbi:YhgE/Pip domain-containing protein [Bacillus sp. AGMB 02131]|uniref:YhgE/Pip domain-containing protein n=1 Tax=Peribacillus faecalis TaxID=2772559 RepID=A0A927HBY9_9BACI|nr:YhgE/Pip domain-containing protein [Peribacillus faecalis]MBD3110270.1 YhgE/Pip domain-containing protein [Peribacillus faecalis]